MSLDDFISKYNGRYIDFDGKFGYQCVDLMRQYCVEVLGIDGWTLPAATYAKQIFQNFPKLGTTKFRKIYNTAWNAPRKGDIIFWGTHWGVTGIAGHVAICSGSNSMNFISFDQNYGQPNFCRFVNHSYKGVLGWLSPK